MASDNATNSDRLPGAQPRSGPATDYPGGHTNTRETPSQEPASEENPSQVNVNGGYSTTANLAGESTGADQPAPLPEQPRRTSRAGWLMWARLLVGTCWLVVVGLIIAAPHLIGRDATAAVGSPWQPPSPEFLLGTDGIGRDVLLRTLAGGQPFVLWPIIAGAATTLVGAFIGLTATRVRWVDQALAWISPALISLPGIVVSLALVQVLPPSVATLITMVMLGGPLSARVLRAAAEPIRTSGAVEAAALRGESWWSIVWRDIRPAMTGAVLGDGLSRVIAALHVLVGLHVIGYGPQPPTPDWGVMLKDGAAGVMLSPWPMLAPAIALALLATSLAVVGELFGRTASRAAGRRTRRRPARRPNPPAQARQTEQASRVTQADQADQAGPAADGDLSSAAAVPSLTAPGVVVRHTTVQYVDGPAVHIPDFAITAGTITAVMGPSGAGKSTLLSLLADTLPANATVRALASSVKRQAHPDSGQSVPGHQPNTESPVSGAVTSNQSDKANTDKALANGAGVDHQVVRYGRVSLAEQQPHATLVRHLPVWRAVADGRRIRRNTVHQVLDQVGLPARVRTLPCRHLSGGQATRVALARAIVRPPEVLILDEPTAGLDAGSATVVGETLRRVAAAGACIVVASHDADWVAQYCDTASTVADGLVSSPTPVTSQEAATSSAPGVSSLDGTRAAAAGRGPQPGTIAYQQPSPAAAGHRSTSAEPMIPTHPGQGVRANQQEPGAQPHPGAVAPVAGLVVDQLCVGLPYGALDQPQTFTVPAGSMTALVGESGVGKTTVLRAIVGLTPYASGTVAALGEPLAAATGRNVAARSRAQRQQLQWVAQDSRLAVTGSETVLQAVRRAAACWHGSTAAAKAAETALRQVGLAESLWQQRAGQCSGGQRQRVCWARALVAQPKVLIMDEPTSALDAATTATVLSVLAELQRTGTAVLAATHDPQVIAAADQHLHLTVD